VKLRFPTKIFFMFSLWNLQNCDSRQESEGSGLYRTMREMPKSAGL